MPTYKLQVASVSGSIVQISSKELVLDRAYQCRTLAGNDVNPRIMQMASQTDCSNRSDGPNDNDIPNAFGRKYVSLVWAEPDEQMIKRMSRKSQSGDVHQVCNMCQRI